MGDKLVRVDLTAEAIRLARTLVALMPDEPEAVGLLALLVLTEARRPARTDSDGAMIRLADQDRRLWNRELITEGHERVRACLRRNQPGPYQLQAAIAAVHADADSYTSTDWTQIVALYDQLHHLRPDPVVLLNRAVAVAEIDGPDVALVQLDADPDTGERLADFGPYHATRADLLTRAGHLGEALAAYDRAIDLTANATELRFLEAQRAAAEPSGD